MESQTAVSKPPGFDNDNSNTQVTELVNYGTGNTQTQVQGPGLLLKVMAGDQVNISSYVWYLNQGTNPNNSNTSPLVSLLASLLGSSSTGIPVEGHFSANQVGNIINAPLSNFVGPTDRTINNSNPKAYINWVLLNDEQLSLQNNGSGAVQVPQIAAGAQKQLLQANNGSPIIMPSNGYLYVFVSNESSTPVYFDNLRIDYTPGPLREENHYYPDGLQMSGISSKAFGAITNNQKYQGAYSELEQETGYNEFELRRYDPQLGRWTSHDPYNQYSSPYIGMGNDWVNGVDMNGGGFEDFFRNASTGDTYWLGNNTSPSWTDELGNVYENIGKHYFSSGLDGLPIEYLWGVDGEHNFHSMLVSEMKNLSQGNLPFEINNDVPEIKQYNKGLFERMSKSDNLLINILYGLGNDIYVTSQLFRNKYEKQNLGGGWANPNDAQKAFINTSMYFVPIGGAEAEVGSKIADAGIEEVAKTSTSFADDAIRLTTSSKSIAPSRTYTIFDGSGQLYKFGVTDANLTRYNQSLRQAGPGAYGKFSSIMPKNQAHIMEKYLRSLHYNSTGQYALPGMKIPYPVNFSTGLPIKP